MKNGKIRHFKTTKMLPRSGMVTSITHSLYAIILLLTKPHTLMPSEFHYISPITSLGHQKPTMKSVVAYIVAYIISYDEYKWSCSPLRGLVESAFWDNTDGLLAG